MVGTLRTYPFAGSPAGLAKLSCEHNSEVEILLNPLCAPHLVAITVAGEHFNWTWDEDMSLLACATGREEEYRGGNMQDPVLHGGSLVASVLGAYILFSTLHIRL